MSKGPKKLYIVGQNHLDGWGFIGAFSDEKVAINECLDEDYFYAEIEQDVAYHIKSREFDTICYPKRKTPQ